MSIRIPPQLLPRIRELSRAHDILDIKTDCAKARRTKAIAEGEEEPAIKADTELRELVREFEVAHNALWDFVHENMPEVQRSGGYSINPSDGVVQEKDQNDLISNALAKALVQGKFGGGRG
jgi:hypothetical protein